MSSRKVNRHNGKTRVKSVLKGASSILENIWCMKPSELIFEKRSQREKRSVIVYFDRVSAYINNSMMIYYHDLDEDSKVKVDKYLDEATTN